MIAAVHVAILFLTKIRATAFGMVEELYGLEF